MWLAAITLLLDLRGSSAPPPHGAKEISIGALIDAATTVPASETKDLPLLSVEGAIGHRASLSSDGGHAGVAVTASSAAARSAIHEAIRRPERNLALLNEGRHCFDFALAVAQRCRSISGCETRLLVEVCTETEFELLEAALQDDKSDVPVSAVLLPRLWDRRRTVSKTPRAATSHGRPDLLPADGAGVPRASLAPEDLPALLMEALRWNDVPTDDAGLRAMWAFAGDTTRFLYQNKITEFLEDAHETADTLPTSFYGVAMHGESWELEGPLNYVGNADCDPWIATQMMKTISRDGRMRRWQWELRKHRRPPTRGAWYVESIGSSDRRGNFEIDG